MERDLRAFLDCGILSHGFLRLRCPACNTSRVVPFSCKRRTFRSSCMGRRMAGTAARLVDQVFPHVPVRQWVLSFPIEIRYRLAYDGPLLSALRGCFLPQLEAYYRGQARHLGPGHLALALKTPWDDGTTHLVFTPLEFLGRLAALTPPPSAPPGSTRVSRRRRLRGIC